MERRVKKLEVMGPVPVRARVPVHAGDLRGRDAGHVVVAEAVRSEERYIASVYQVPFAAKPSCSMPIDLALMYQLPACHATSRVSTCWAMCPSEERSE